MPGYASIPGNTQPWGTQVFSGVRQAPTAEAVAPEQTLTTTQVVNGWEALTVVAAPNVNTLTDSFPTQVDKGSTWITSSPVTVWDASGRAKIPCTAAYPNLGSTLYDLTGSAVFALVSPAIGGSRETFLQVLLDVNNKLEIFVSGNTGSNLSCRKMVAGTPTVLASTPYSSTTHAWWRIRESGGTVFFDTAPDGQTWTNLGSTTVAASIPVTSFTPNFISGYYGSETAADTFIDNVNLTPVIANRATTWGVLAPVTAASRTTSWKVAAVVTASRATTWNVLSLGITDPTSIPNCETWYDASILADFTFTTGTTVQRWADKSGNAGPRFISQGTSGNLPERVGGLNGKPTVVWGRAGADTAGMTTVDQGYNPPAQPLTFWCVAQVQSNTYRGVIGGGGGVQGIRRQGDNSLGFDWGTAVPYAMDNTNYHIIVAVAAGASSRQRIDGVQVGAANTGTGDPGTFSLGVDNDNQHLTGAIAEAGMYSRALTTTELTQLESYLNKKWFSAAGSPAWMVDFTDDPDGVPTGWTTTGGLEVGPATVISGVYQCPQTYWHSVVSYDTPFTTNNVYCNAEVVYATAAGDIDIGVIRTSDGALDAFRLRTDGAVIQLTSTGGNTVTTWTPPAVGVPFLLEFTWTTTAVSLKLNGTLIAAATGPPNITTVPDKSQISMAGGMGMRKWSSGDGAPPVVAGTTSCYRQHERRPGMSPHRHHAATVVAATVTVGSSGTERR